MDDGADVIVKIDGDGQMDSRMIGALVYPLLRGECDYTKGNRFHDLESVRAMPRIRLFGNAILSFMNKLSSGYWHIFDPTNGFTAIRADVARLLPFGKISHRYFFESDMLFRLNTLQAMVMDVPMPARYGDEVSNLRISRVAGEFLGKHMRNFLKRVVYNYYLRGMSVASLELPIGMGLLGFGFAFGLWQWILSGERGVPATSGTVTLAALSLILGMQLLLAFLAADMAAVPRRPLCRMLPPDPKTMAEWISGKQGQP
jgi:hypothetical protein